MSKRAKKPGEFVALKIAVLTISDTRVEADDTSGDLLCRSLVDAGHMLAGRGIVRDDIAAIRDAVGAWITGAKSGEADCIITTGGTGLTGRDVTPEALRGIFEKEIEGFGEMFRQLSYAKIGTSALQSRALAGVAGGVYIFALPGSPSACRDGWEMILAPQLDIRHRPCNFAEIMPRLTEK